MMVNAAKVRRRIEHTIVVLKAQLKSQISWCVRKGQVSALGKDQYSQAAQPSVTVLDFTTNLTMRRG